MVRLSVWLTLVLTTVSSELAPLAAQVLADAVEDHDRVVHRVAGDGQDGGDDVQRQVVAEEHQQRERDQHVVQRRGDRADREREAEADADVDGDADDRRQRGVDALALQVRADHRADDLLADDLELAEVGLGHRVDDRARALLERRALLGGQLRQADQPSRWRPASPYCWTTFSPGTASSAVRSGVFRHRLLELQHDDGAAREVDAERQPLGGDRDQPGDDDQRREAQWRASATG